MDTAEPELKALMIASLEGDAGAYRALLGDLRLRLGGYFSRRLRRDPDDVEDLVQDTLIAIHTRRETYDRAQALTPWVYAVARYKLIDHYRRSGRRVFTPLEDAGSELRVEDHGAAVAARRDVERALAALSERTRAIIRDTRIEGLSMAEAAERAGLTEGAAKVAAHRGLKALTDRYAGRSDRHD
jgi:RNA polymerase sigma-70 factor (ECF subfamily)